MNDNKLMESLLAAKKVMNKVESGNFSKGNIDKKMLSEDTEQLIPEPTKRTQTTSSPGEYKAKVSESRLPEAIKQAMLETQIPQPDIDFSGTISLDFAEKVSKKMEQMNLKESKSAKKQPKQQQSVDEDEFTSGNFNNQRKPIVVESEQKQSINETLINEMKPLIKEIIQSTLENTIERILTEKLNKYEKEHTINEKLQIKVGDSLFIGNIVGVKQIKK